MRLRASLVFSAAAVLAACKLEPAYVGTIIDDTGKSLCAETASETESSRCFIDPLLETSVPERFAKPTSESFAPPRIAYPSDESMHAPNVDLLTLHFERASPSEDAFEIKIFDPSDLSTTRVLYVPCQSTGGSGCTYQLPEKFLDTTFDALRGRSIELRLRASTSKGPGPGATLRLKIAPEDVRGGLFYWSSELRGLYRLLFGARKAVPYIEPRTAENPDACAGCHSVSRDGTTVGFTRGKAEDASSIYENAAFNGYLTVASVLTPEKPTITQSDGAPSDSAMLALSSDGSRVVSAFNYGLSLRDTETSAILDEFDGDGEKKPFFPEYSPDDSLLAITLSKVPDSEIAVRSGSIALISMSDSKFGAVRELVPASEGEAHYYPTFSPDGRFVAFVTGPGTSKIADKSYDQTASRLRLVNVESGAIVELSRASAPDGMGATWPKFAPFVQCESGGTECPEAERLYFLTFSSRRDYGLLLRGGTKNPSQLWMSALAIGRASDGEDPSFPAVWIPYQSRATSNHLGIWTEVLRCSDILPCGPFETCTKNGVCEPLVR